MQESFEACKINRKVIGRLCEESLDESYGKTKQCIKKYVRVYHEEKLKTEVTELWLKWVVTVGWIVL